MSYHCCNVVLGSPSLSLFPSSRETSKTFSYQSSVTDPNSRVLELRGKGMAAMWPGSKSTSTSKQYRADSGLRQGINMFNRPVATHRALPVINSRQTHRFGLWLFTETFGSAQTPGICGCGRPRNLQHMCAASQTTKQKTKKGD